MKVCMYVCMYVRMYVLNLVCGCEGVDVASLRPGHRSHLNRRVQLHCAASCVYVCMYVCMYMYVYVYMCMYIPSEIMEKLRARSLLSKCFRYLNI